METLKQIGMNRGWIYEVIISTYQDKIPHSAPIGVWTKDFTTLHMEIYKNTRTIINIMTFREFTVNLISDIMVFYEALFDKAKIAYEKSRNVNAPFIKGSPAVIEFKLKEVEEKEKTFHLTAIPIHVQINGSINLINRAEALTLESLILATKLPYLPQRQIKETLQENYRVIMKVAPGSQYEKILRILLEYLQIP
jgi:hypothetical protein